MLAIMLRSFGVITELLASYLHGEFTINDNHGHHFGFGRMLAVLSCKL
jgi:hypothetical protein